MAQASISRPSAADSQAHGSNGATRRARVSALERYSRHDSPAGGRSRRAMSGGGLGMGPSSLLETGGPADSATVLAARKQPGAAPLSPYARRTRDSLPSVAPTVPATTQPPVSGKTKHSASTAGHAHVAERDHAGSAAALHGHAEASHRHTHAGRHTAHASHTQPRGHSHAHAPMHGQHGYKHKHRHKHHHAAAEVQDGSSSKHRLTHHTTRTSGGGGGTGESTGMVSRHDAGELPVAAPSPGPTGALSRSHHLTSEGGGRGGARGSRRAQQLQATGSLVRTRSPVLHPFTRHSSSTPVLHGTYSMATSAPVRRTTVSLSRNMAVTPPPDAAREPRKSEHRQSGQGTHDSADTTAEVATPPSLHGGVALGAEVVTPEADTGAAVATKYGDIKPTPLRFFSSGGGRAGIFDRTSPSGGVSPTVSARYRSDSPSAVRSPLGRRRGKEGTAADTGARDTGGGSKAAATVSRGRRGSAFCGTGLAAPPGATVHGALNQSPVAVGDGRGPGGHGRNTGAPGARSARGDGDGAGRPSRAHSRTARGSGGGNGSSGGTGGDGKRDHNDGSEGSAAPRVRLWGTKQRARPGTSDARLTTRRHGQRQPHAHGHGSHTLTYERSTGDGEADMVVVAATNVSSGAGGSTTWVPHGAVSGQLSRRGASRRSILRGRRRTGDDGATVDGGGMSALASARRAQAVADASTALSPVTVPGAGGGAAKAGRRQWQRSQSGGDGWDLRHRDTPQPRRSRSDSAGSGGSEGDAVTRPAFGRRGPGAAPGTAHSGVRGWHSTSRGRMHDMQADAGHGAHGGDVLRAASGKLSPVTAPAGEGGGGAGGVASGSAAASHYGALLGNVGRPVRRLAAGVSTKLHRHPTVASAAAVSITNLHSVRKHPNQDSFIVHHDEATNTLMLAVFDGHGTDGHRVSQFFASHLAPTLFADPRFKLSPSDALVDVLLEIEVAAANSESMDTDFSGCTAVVMLIRDSTAVVLNVGDSRAVAASHTMRGGLSGTALTHDHKPDAPAERSRVHRAGGTVMLCDGGVWRVTMKLATGTQGLAMTRSMCDVVAKAFGVVSTPDVSYVRLCAAHRAIVLGSDGIWDMITSREAVHMLGGCASPLQAAQKLTRIARARWVSRQNTSDDITVVVAFMHGE